MDEVRLRPLSIAEIFDRAITLYVRNFVPFLIVAAFVAVPMAIAQYYMGAANGQTWQQILAQAQHPGSTPIDNTPPIDPMAGMVMLFAICAQPFMYVAMAALVGRIYRGEPPEWPAAYDRALRHTGGIIMTLLCAAGIFLLSAFGLVMLFVFLAVIAAAAFRASAPVGVAFFGVIALVMLCFFELLFLIGLSVSMALNAIGIEEAPFGVALREGFARVFNRTEIKKAALLVLAMAAIQFGVIFLNMGLQGVTEMVFHAPLLDALCTGVVLLLSSGFSAVLVAVYYFDVRVRREGLDVQAALDAIAVPTHT